ncbi:hypothetical protein GCM10022278_14460 [Allohahella marinimesophila]|uniref:Uncharacterized protein n=1 Tax=Allohahella marinimesophila TaxID=1054972 RepID=A0ABP7NZ55_9GAMM
MICERHNNKKLHPDKLHGNPVTDGDHGAVELSKLQAQSEQTLIPADLEMQSLSNIDGLTGVNERACLSILMVHIYEFNPFNDS